MSNLVQAAEVGLAKLLSVLRSHINDYCDLETTWENSYVAKDGSMATVLRYDGFRSLIGRNEYKSFIESLCNGLDPYLSNRGHQVQVVYHRDDDPSEELDEIMQASYETCEALQLNLKDILDEKKDVHRALCMSEAVFLVLWTRPAVLDPVEVKLHAQENRELAKIYKMPGFSNAQNFMRPIRFMIDRHNSYVEGVKLLFETLKGAVTELPVHRAFCETKRYLYRSSTPPTWRPTLLGDPMMVRWKNNSKRRDISELCYPRLDDQLFSGPAINGNTNGEGGVSDTRAVRVGDRLFAPVMLKIPPQRPTAFSALFQSMNRVASGSSSKPIPWSIAFMLEGDGLKGITLRKMFAGILGMTSLDNRNLLAAANSLSRYKEAGGTVVKFHVTAVTWAPWNDEKTLMIRRSKLSRALAGWGNAVIEEETGDPTEALMSCVPGVTLRTPAPGSAPPLGDAVYMLPLARPASPFLRGSSPYRTLDGKLLPWETFSDQQNTWISLYFGGPGSGKSVEANRRNVEMCLMPGLTRLPFIGVIDIGVSSSGFVMLVKDALPETKKHLAVYVRIQNTEKYRINQLDTQLGSRKPLPREREYIKNWLVNMATPAERGTAHHFMPDFCARVIDEAYERCSDQSERGKPKEYSPNVNQWLHARVVEAGLHIKEATKFWEVVDMFFERGMVYEASVAQRYAVPTLFDIMNVGADEKVTKEFLAANGEASVVSEFSIMIRSAGDDFPVFNGVTLFDTGESRVMALDLQDVVTTGSKSAEKQASLMYMMAINAFMRKINLSKEDLDSVNPKYRSYHANRVDELNEDLKRLFVDEYHKTGNNANLREAFLIYGRESRKWGLEIALGSQLPRDFADLANLATTTVIMDAGNEQTRGQIKEVFGLSETETAALRQFVNGPQRGIGTTFLAKLKIKDAELSQLFTSTIGGMELWALATTMEDRGLRGLLYEAMPPPAARRLLKKRFPTGSCKSFVDQAKATSRQEQGEGFVDEDAMRSVIQRVASEMIAEYQVSANQMH